MHHVDRGPEPEDLGAIRAQHTQPWIQFYRDSLGHRPSDSHWRRFAEHLENVKGVHKTYQWGGGIVYHRRDDRGPYGRWSGDRLGAR